MNKMKKGVLVLSLFSLSGLLALVGNNQKANENIFEESTTLENQNAKKLNVRSNSSGDVLVSNVLKAQVSETTIKNGENVKSLRVVAGISDLNITPYFDRAEINVDGNVIMPQKNTYVSCAYETITENGAHKTAAEFFKSADYNYFVTYTLKDIPEQYWFTPISITLKVEGSDTSVSKTLNVAALVDEYINDTNTFNFFKLEDNSYAISLKNQNVTEINVPAYYYFTSDESNFDYVMLKYQANITKVGNDLSGNFYSTTLEKVTIPEGITCIGDHAFSCKKLSSIALPQSLKEIGNFAFVGTSSLEQIILPKNVTLKYAVFGDHHENLKIYFEGNTISSLNWDAEWSFGIEGSLSDHFFLYSETKPTGTSTSDNGYWHYDTNNQPVIW